MTITSHRLLKQGEEDIFPYPIDYSMRVDGSSEYLSYTPSSPGNSKTFTIRCWTKPDSVAATDKNILSAGDTSSNYFSIRWTTGGRLELLIVSGGVVIGQYSVPRLGTDLTAWREVVLSIDTTQSGSSDRVKIWDNGNPLTLTATTVLTQNTDAIVMSTVTHTIGRLSYLGVSYYPGGLTSVDIVDGTAYDGSTTWGEYSDKIAGLWIPKIPETISYGTNGSRLTFSNAANLGEDSSGNNNDWTSIGSPAQTIDTPTNNYCILNAVDNLTTGTLSNGNLTTTGNATVTHRPSSGQWYYEKDGVGVSYDANIFGQFDPTLTAGTYNFGARAWDDTGPTGNEKAINSENMPDDDYTTSGNYTGNGSDNYVYTGCTLSQLVVDGGGTYDNDGTDYSVVEFYANGFKMVSTTDNISSTSYDWTGTLKYPYKYSNAQGN